MFCYCETLFLRVISHRDCALLWPQQHGNDEYYHAEQSDDTILPMEEQEPQVGLSMLSVKSKELEASPTITDIPDTDRGNHTLRKFGMIARQMRGNYLQWKMVCTSGARPTGRKEMFGECIFSMRYSQRKFPFILK